MRGYLKIYTIFPRINKNKYIYLGTELEKNFGNSQIRWIKARSDYLHKKYFLGSLKRTFYTLFDGKTDFKTKKIKVRKIGNVKK